MPETTLPHKELLAGVPLFSGIDTVELINTLDDCKVITFKSGEYLCREGEYDEACNIILDGTASVELPQKGANRGKKIPLAKGEIFGEIAALSGNPRTADIVATQPSTLMNISKNTLFRLLDRFPAIKQKLDDLYRHRALSSHLHTIPIFSGIPDEILEELKEKVTLHTYRKGDVIFEEGDMADAFYLTRYGFVKVHQRKGGKEKVLAYLKDGHYFGEMGLLKNGEKRMATVSALNRVEVIRISKEDFGKLIESHPDLRANLENVVKQREERNILLSKDAHLANTLSSTIEAGVMQSKAVLIIDTSKCIQCDNCIKACASLHGGQTRLARKGIRLSSFLMVPASCRHCDDPTCMTKCPTGAISRDFTGEIYHKDSCIGCGSCAMNCPHGNITIIDAGGPNGRQSLFARLLGNNSNHKRQYAKEKNAGGNGPEIRKPKRPKRKAVKCDMCRDYAIMGCVHNCPRGAARRVNPSVFFADISSIG